MRLFSSIDWVRLSLNAVNTAWRLSVFAEWGKLIGVSALCLSVSVREFRSKYTVHKPCVCSVHKLCVYV